MSNKYLILDTEETIDFSPSLIGTIATKEGEEVNNITGTLFYKMKTIDGILLFLESELRKID